MPLARSFILISMGNLGDRRLADDTLAHAREERFRGSGSMRMEGKREGKDNEALESFFSASLKARTSQLAKGQSNGNEAWVLCCAA